MKAYWRLALVSFLTLFLELLIIRLIGTEIRVFAYLGNLVLLAIFVGSGIGMYRKKSISVSVSAAFLFLTATLTVTMYILRTSRFDVKLFSGLSELLAPLSEAYIWQTLNTFSKTGAVFGVLLTGAILILISAIFIPLGNLLGRLFSEGRKPLAAYSVNVGASLLGMWAFQLFSLAGLPPLLGLTIASFSLFFLSENRIDKAFVVGATMAIIALAAPKIAYQPYEGPTTFWSPYQKLTLSLISPSSEKPYRPAGYYLEVNNVGYMGLLDLSSEHEATVSAVFQELHRASREEIPFLNQYTLPYELKPHPDDVLIIGAGAGNDAHGALQGGAKHIDAVEIDPVIMHLGNMYHPNKPSQSTQVTSIVDDGRSFMERTDKQYDVIVMGLADSHTLSSALTNLRLDHYLYTGESLTRARELLKPDGILVLSFEVTRPWIGERLTRTLTDVFGTIPTTFEVRSDGAFGWGGYFFVEGKNPEIVGSILAQNPDLKSFIETHKKTFSTNTNPLTDDWPYLYLDHPRLPLLYLLMAGFLVAVLAMVKKTVLKDARLDLPMFFWGAAFLLFEFQNISKAGLLFGLTWQTNMIIISSALLFILLANGAVQKRLMNEKIAFMLLVASLLLQVAVPLHALNRWPLLMKLLFGGALLNLPFFFGGAIFAKWFNQSKDRPSAFASNLIGAAFGGLLEMFSFLLGIKALLFFAMILYVAGWITKKQRFALQ